MITSATDMLAALRRKRFAGIVLYRGPSMLDGSPVVAIANRITDKSDNAKTGAIVQTFIIRADIDPLTALRNGLDASVCGNCLHRPANNGTCYVNVGRSVMATYGAFTRGRYAEPGVDYDPSILPDVFAGKGFRIGSYGDGTAVPFQIWRRATVKAAFVNGYTHQWQSREFAAFKLLCMASVDTADEYERAVAAGWRTFRVRHADAAKAPREVVCPASAEAGKRTSCADCKACGGHSAKAKANIVIVAHGATKKRFVNA